ncbi:MAG: hypothetical protein IKM97_00015 [Clostridia bacterium]|nr:hypothetical protein [Clostridia bacterium]
MKLFLLFIGVCSGVFGVKFVFDARPIVKKYFSMGDKNEGVLAIKIFGFFLLIISGLLVYYNLY